MPEPTPTQRQNRCSTRDGRLRFWCPGCDDLHVVTIAGAYRWEWNGSLERPTINPSILVTMPGLPDRCHSFVRDGRIQFLADCTHLLAGQTVPLPIDYQNVRLEAEETPDD